LTSKNSRLDLCIVEVGDLNLKAPEHGEIKRNRIILSPMRSQLSSLEAVLVMEHIYSLMTQEMESLSGEELNKMINVLSFIKTGNGSFLILALIITCIMMDISWKVVGEIAKNGTRLHGREQKLRKFQTINKNIGYGSG